MPGEVSEVEVDLDPKEGALAATVATPGDPC